MAVNGFQVQDSGVARCDLEADTLPVAGGHHLLVDFWVEDAEPLRWSSTWERLLPSACRGAGATVLGSRFHQFEPEGVTGIVLLAESHASVHTWPEAGLVTLDVFTCGALDTEAIVESVRQALRPSRERVTAVARGNATQPDLEIVRTPRSASRPPHDTPTPGQPHATMSLPRSGGDPHRLPFDSTVDPTSRSSAVGLEDVPG